MTEQEKIERAIESAKCRIYRVRANVGKSMEHQVKADNQAEIQQFTIQALEQYQKIHIALASMETEADECHKVAHQMQNDGMYDLEGKMLVKEEAFRDCISMIKEELGMV